MEKYDEKTPINFSELDIKDAFWRLVVSSKDAWNFYHVLPHIKKVESIEDIKVVVPNCIQMEWCDSPPFFCAASETTNYYIDTLLYEVNLPEHPLEEKMILD